MSDTTRRDSEQPEGDATGVAPSEPLALTEESLQSRGDSAIELSVEATAERGTPLNWAEEVEREEAERDQNSVRVVHHHHHHHHHHYHGQQHSTPLVSADTGARSRVPLLPPPSASVRYSPPHSNWESDGSAPASPPRSTDFEDAERRGRLVELDEEIDATQAVLEDHQGKIDALKDNIAAQENRLDAAEGRVNGTGEQLDALDEQVQSLSGEIPRHTANLRRISTLLNRAHIAECRLEGFERQLRRVADENRYRRGSPPRFRIRSPSRNRGRYRYDSGSDPNLADPDDFRTRNANQLREARRFADGVLRRRARLSRERRLREDRQSPERSASWERRLRENRQSPERSVSRDRCLRGNRQSPARTSSGERRRRENRESPARAESVDWSERNDRALFRAWRDSPEARRSPPRHLSPPAPSTRSAPLRVLPQGLSRAPITVTSTPPPLSPGRGVPSAATLDSPPTLGANPRAPVPQQEATASVSFAPVVPSQDAANDDNALTNNNQDVQVWLTHGVRRSREVVRRLFLRVLWQVVNGQLNVTGRTDEDAAWGTFTALLIRSGQFRNANDVSSAWYFAFQEPPRAQFRSFVIGGIRVIRNMIDGAERAEEE